MKRASCVYTEKTRRGKKKKKKESECHPSRSLQAPSNQTLTCSCAFFSLVSLPLYLLSFFI